MMEERHEIVSFSSDIPIKVFIHRLGSVSKHWHSSMEILFVLSGEVCITVNDQSYRLLPDDLILVNSNSLHELYSENGELAAFQMKLERFPLFEEYKQKYYDCCSVSDTDNPKFNFLRFLLARLIKDNAEGENKLSTIALMATLINELNQHFQCEDKKNISSSQKHLNRLRSITEYIQKNYRDSISLNELAASEHLSVSHLSRFFVQHFGMNFTTYYNQVRLEYAVNELLSSDEPISTIALHNGFTDARSFVSLFRSKYGELPSTYRKKNDIFPVDSSVSTGINYFEVSSFSTLSNLAKYLDFEQSDHTSPSQLPENAQKTYIEADYCSPVTSLTHNYHKVCCVGSAKEMLFTDIQEMLRRQQKEIGYEHIKFHGILCDDMLVYDETASGVPHVSFVLVDRVLDFLLSIQLKPIIQISFMPKKLASNQQRTNFYLEYNTSPPKDIERWNWLVTQLVEHLISRYSVAEIQKWLFCVWNEPDTSTDMFGFDEREDFFNFYKETYQTVKSIQKDLCFGTPSLMMISDYALDWDFAFFEYCKTHDCLPDFLNLHYYDDNIEILSLPTRPGVEKPNMLNGDADAFSEFLDQLKLKIQDIFGHELPIYLTEWNLTVNHRNLINDTCFKSCYIAKNLLENYDKLDSFGYWSLTDLICELPPSPNLFHGGLGLFTNNGIPKAHYYVFRLLAKLGNSLISRGSGWFMTRSQHSVQLALYNYEHYSRLYASGELFDMTDTNRYTPFTLSQCQTFHLTLTGLPYEKAVIREYTVNREHGSPFDYWIRMGAPSSFTSEDLELLKAGSQPGLYIHTSEVQNQQIELKFTLDPLEFRFVEICF